MSLRFHNQKKQIMKGSLNIGFKIIGVKVLPNCPEYIHKVLKPDRTYFFYEGYEEVSENCVRRVGESEDLRIYDVEGKNGTIRINVCAVVGRNGEGKSTLIELVLRILNNFANYLGFSYSQDSLRMVDYLCAVLFYEIDGILFSIRSENGNVKWFRGTDEIKAVEDKTDMERVNMLKQKTDLPLSGEDKWECSLFYTTVINYALYAYNSIHLDKESSNGSWIDGLFHKNDAYQTPVVINPMRTQGNINVNKEEHLSRQRLMAIFTDAGSDKTRRMIAEGVEAYGFGFAIDKGCKLLDISFAKYFEEMKDRRCDFEALNNLDTTDIYKSLCPGLNEFWASVEQLLSDNPALSEWLEWYGDKLEHKPSTDLSDIVDRIYEAERDDTEWNLQLVQNMHRFLPDGKLRWMNFTQLYRVLLVLEIWKALKEECGEMEEILDVYLWERDNIKNKVVLYIPYKVHSILTTYEPYYKRKYHSDEDCSSMLDVWPTKHLKRQIREDLCAILDTDDYTTLKLRQSLNYLKYHDGDLFEATAEDQMPEGVDSIVTFEQLNKQVAYGTTMADTVKFLPPPVFNGDIVLKNEEAKKYLLHTISSGQMQKLNVAGSLVYHLRNLDYRVPDTDRVEYSNVNVIFDELELYFHPDYQRTLLNYLLEQIGNAKLENIENINLILVTHSPFILTDIPKSNILYLSKKEDEIPKRMTMAANIYDLLDDQFFLEYTIGDVIRKEIEEFIAVYQDKKNYKNLSDYIIHRFEQLIPLIGDDFIREDLDSKLREIQAVRKGTQLALKEAYNRAIAYAERLKNQMEDNYGQ